MQAAYETGTSALRPADGAGGADVRSDQAGPGFRQFLLRGLEKVNREWLLICAVHNLLKLSAPGPGGPPT